MEDSLKTHMKDSLKPHMEDSFKEEVIQLCEPVAMGDDLILLTDMSKLPIPAEPYRTQHIIAALCLRGKAQYSVDTEERTIKAGELIIIQKGRVTDNYMLSNDLQGIAVVMSKNFFDDMVKDVQELRSLFIFSRIHAVIGLTEEEIADVILFFNIMKRKIQETDNHFRKDIVRSLMTTLIYNISNAIHRVQEHATTGKYNRAEEIFATFISLVEQNFRSERRVSWYSAQMNITSKYLSETIKQASSRTPNEWIDNYVSLEIRLLLKNTTKTIKEITEYMNFPSQSFLGKFFKERVGMSPSDYRKG